MKIQVCRQCGNRNTVVSKALKNCNYCGSSDLEDISFNEAVDLLAKSSGLDYRIVNNTILVAGANKLKQGFGKKVTRVFKMRNSDPAEVKKSINLLIADKSIRVDKRTSSLIVYTSYGRFQIIDETCKTCENK